MRPDDFKQGNLLNFLFTIFFPSKKHRNLCKKNKLRIYGVSSKKN